ncbi:Uncharacterised protein [Vibrio cholerae]|nr:Uncharacterised protein [Vibrio cholerae]CSB65867.1 Uncharacterised protein [Vibrio cholerae]CSI64531.1 Uncharacterised protein [Vibrio cholerae]
MPKRPHFPLSIPIHSSYKRNSILNLTHQSPVAKSQRFCISSATIKSKELRLAKSDNPCCKPCLTQGSASMLYLGELL